MSVNAAERNRETSRAGTSLQLSKEQYLEGICSKVVASARIEALYWSTAGFKFSADLEANAPSRHEILAEQMQTPFPTKMLSPMVSWSLEPWSPHWTKKQRAVSALEKYHGAGLIPFEES